MCIATPVKIIKKIDDKRCEVEGGRIVDLSLVPDTQKGDWLLCHADLAINKVEAKEAKDILKLNKACFHGKGTC